VSRRSYSKHMPDFRLITYYSESGRSLVHDMNPWTKAALLGVVIMLATVLTSVYTLCAMFALTIVFYLAGRLPFRVLLGWYTLPMLFVVTLAVMFVFSEPGEDLFRVGIGSTSVGITDGGVLLLLKLILRALAVVTLSLAVVMTTKYQQIAYMAHRTMPGPLATVFLLSYRFLFVTTDEVTDILDAMHARNGNMLKGFSRQTRLFAGIFGLGFVHAFERAERISKAMESRGFTGELPVAQSVGRPSAAGYALVAASLIMVAVAAYSRYIEEFMFGW